LEKNPRDSILNHVQKSVAKSGTQQMKFNSLHKSVQCAKTLTKWSTNWINFSSFLFSPVSSLCIRVGESQS